MTPAWGQGVNTPAVMHTGSGLPLSSLFYTNSAAGADIPIYFGFATDEAPQPGVFLDSFTISISGPGGTGYLVTVDGSGIQFAPNVPGGLPIPPGSSLQASPFLASTEGLTNMSSYSVDYQVPAAWQGSQLTLNFDLFDNQDSLRSLGYFLVPVAVPEPSASTLLLLGVLAYAMTRRQRVE
jgi:hypothetical protein